MADPPLGFVLNVKIFPLKRHNGGEGARGPPTKEFNQKTKQLHGSVALKRGDGGRRGPKFKRFLFVLFWTYCHHCGVLPSAQEGVDLTSTLSHLQCQEVCPTVCKYLDASMLPLLDRGAAPFCSLRPFSTRGSFQHLRPRSRPWYQRDLHATLPPT